MHEKRHEDGREEARAAVRRKCGDGGRMFVRGRIDGVQNMRRGCGASIGRQGRNGI